MNYFIKLITANVEILQEKFPDRPLRTAFVG